MKSKIIKTISLGISIFLLLSIYVPKIQNLDSQNLTEYRFSNQALSVTELINVVNLLLNLGVIQQDQVLETVITLISSLDSVNQRSETASPANVSNNSNTTATPKTTSTNTCSLKSSPNLTIGSRGNYVIELQNYLISTGDLAMPSGVSKGYFGTLTQNALASYQRKNNITPATGYFGPVTRSRFSCNTSNVQNTNTNSARNTEEQTEEEIEDEEEENDTSSSSRSSGSSGGGSGGGGSSSEEVEESPEPIIGVCGSSNNNAFSETPSTNLCSAGTSSSVSLSGNSYSWSCAGAHGGSNASCSATYEAEVEEEVVEGNYYIDPNASGDGSGTTWSNAWNSIESINWDLVGSGDTIWIAGGNYNEAFRFSTKSGLSIKIDPDAEEQAIFQSATTSQLYDFDDGLVDGLVDGEPMIKIIGSPENYDNPTEGALFLVRRSQNVVIRGIEIDRSAMYQGDSRMHGISLNNSSAPSNDNVVIEDSYIHHLTADGININSSAFREFDHFIIRRNTITNVMDDGVQAGSGLTLHDNIIDAGGEDPEFGGHPDGIQTAIGASHIKIYNNIFSDFNQNIFVEKASGHIYLYNNIMVGGKTSGSDRGMNISAQDVFSGDWLIVNNTFYDFITYPAINGTLATISDDQKIIGNNLFVNCKYLANASLLDSSNAYWDEPGVQYYDTSGNPVEILYSRSDGSLVGDAQYLNPKLVNASGDNFQLMSDSAVIDIGNDFSSYINKDIEGNSRPSGSGWDIGAYEYDSGVSYHNEAQDIYYKENDTKNQSMFRSVLAKISSVINRGIAAIIGIFVN